MWRYLSPIFIFLVPFSAQSQVESFVESASIVADSIAIDAEGNLTAKGNVEIHYNETILKAQEIYYLRLSDELSAKEPLSLIDSSGNETKAQNAIFKDDFREAILLATRVILKNQLEISAEKLEYVINKKSDFSSVFATSCMTCKNEKPFWLIKAKKVSHNEELKTIYFFDASLEILGFPAFYTPYISIPDPTSKRAIGFLAPECLSNSRLDFGVKLPFFIPLDVDKDITFTTFFTRQTNTIELRYRQAFSNGKIVVDSALTKDQLDEDKYRGYLSLNGNISLDNGYNLDYAIERVSDSAYLGDYGYYGRNGLSSGLSYYKTQSDRFFETSIGLVQSLYKDDISKITIDTNSYYERVIDPRKIAGRIYVTSEIVGSWRNGTYDIAGRDAARIGNKIRWQNTLVSPNGMEFGGNLEYNNDIFLIAQDSRYKSSQALNSIGGNAFARYPLLVKNSGATHLLEPLAQIAWGWREQAKVSNDESSHTEFDMGNLMAISRFTASDRYEDGSHGAYGLRYSYETRAKYRFDFGLGKVLRNDSHYGFTDSSGLRDRKSENYITGVIKLPQNSYFSFQGLIDEKLRTKKSALIGSLDFKTFNLEAEYNYLQADFMEYRYEPVEEWTIRNNLKLSKNWNFASNLRFDETEDHLALLGAGLTYENQCVLFNLEMDKRYSQEGTSPPTTNFSFAISLKGFSTGKVTSISEKSCK